MSHTTVRNCLYVGHQHKARNSFWHYFCQPRPGVSDNALREWIINEAWGHHASCSCKTGAEGGRLAVLDNNFRVRGTTNLRVVDASVFPYIPRFFIVTPIYMIAEKASEVILNNAQHVSI